MITAFTHNKDRHPPFTLKMTKNTPFLMIFMIKTVGGVNIPPGISINIHDNRTLRIEIEIPDLTD